MYSNIFFIVGILVCLCKTRAYHDGRCSSSIRAHILTCCYVLPSTKSTGMVAIQVLSLQDVWRSPHDRKPQTSFDSEVGSHCANQVFQQAQRCFGGFLPALGFWIFPLHLEPRKLTGPATDSVVSKSAQLKNPRMLWSCDCLLKLLCCWPTVANKLG